MSGIAGLRGTGDWGADERPKSFREGILFYTPNGNSPIFALTGKAGKKTVKDPEFSWWNEPNTLVRLQVNGALGAGDTVVVVDTPDPTSTTMAANWGTASHLKAGDLLMVEPAADAQAYAPEIIEVESVQGDTAFVAKRGAAGTTPAAIGNDAWLFLIGNSYAEGTGVPAAVSRNPIKFFNYTQIFKDSYELTKTADVTESRTGDAWSNDKKRKMHDHSRAIELSILWGIRSETVGANGKPKRTFGGLRTFIPTANTTVFGAAVTPRTFLDALAPMFDFNTGAGDTRIGFMGHKAALEISKVLATEATYNVSNGVIKVYGMNFQEFITPQGRILLKIHPLMSRHPLYQKSMFCLDFDALKYVTLPGRDTKTHDDVQNKDEDVRRGYVQTECSIAVDYGGLTMAYLGNISAT